MNAKLVMILVVVGFTGFFSQPAYTASKITKDVDKRKPTSESV